MTLDFRRSTLEKAGMSPRFGGTVEFTPDFTPRPQISHALFDFDGTLSLIRQGWPDVMVPMFMEMLPRQAGETDNQLQRLVFDDIMRLNGKQTIYQMIQLAERITQRGGSPRDPLWYKKEYLRRLNHRIEHRLNAIRNKTAKQDEFVVHGARGLLDQLKSLNFTLYLASGTDERFVKEETELLGLSHYFGQHIYGARDDYKSFSKKMIIQQILRDNNIPGDQLISFGDGYVEIQNTREAGGLAIAVASDEANNGSGRMDEWKRQRLLGVGAHVVIPDYRDSQPLLARIRGASQNSSPQQ